MLHFTNSYVLDFDPQVRKSYILDFAELAVI